MREDKFTNKLRQIMIEAQSLALANDACNIDPVHALKILLEPKNDILKLLIGIGLNSEGLIKDLNEEINKLPKIHGNSGEILISRDLINILNLMDKYSIKNNDEYISFELFLPAAIESGSNAGKLLIKHGLSKEKIDKLIKDLRGEKKVDNPDAEEQRGALAKYTIDLTKRAREGKLDPVIGRDDEIRRTIQVLQRRTKNNPVIIGEPGVGKTAIVEGLAQRMVNNEVPDSLKNKDLLVLDLASLIAGTKYRGQFEERLKNVLSDLTKEESKTIIFIDEIHTLVGAGNVEGGTMDAGNMLKPSLARGELHCIGATTLDEYRKYIEKDAALERRFQKVFVAEPSVEDTIAILRGLQKRYETHHGVEITDPAIVAAATLSHRYITDRFLPDKAIDLIDEAASRIKIEIDSKPEEMDRLDRKLIQLRMEKMHLEREHDDASKKRLTIIENEIKELNKEYIDLEQIWKAEKVASLGSAQINKDIQNLQTKIDILTREGKLETASELKYGELPKLEKQLELIEKKENNPSKNKLFRTKVDDEQIAQILSKMTGIPVSKMMQGEKEKLLKMEEVLHKRVIGQDEAVTAIANAIRRSRSGLGDPNKPYGSFLFLGPTGVGKTELCKTLARFLFDSEDHLIRIDMSEYMEKHTVSRLIGAPPGYIGYEEGGYLTEQIRRKPYSVILLDEIEKAHPDVFNILLQVLDDGRLTDGHGRTVDFKNTVIVMTSNIGSQNIQQMGSSASYDDIKATVMNEVKDYLKPELINRIDEIVVFHSLDKDNIFAIAKIQLDILKQRLMQHDLTLNIDDKALEFLSKVGFDLNYGARPLKRAIQNIIENPLAKNILEGKYLPNSTINITADNDEIIFK